jgi:hypothetical protein
MRTEASFQQILESKIKRQSQSQNQENHVQQAFEQFPQQPMNQDPAHLAYLMGQMNPIFFRPARKVYPSRPKPPPPPHSLTEEQRLAISFFALYGVTLSPAFPQKELKKAFRTLALKLHPDTNKGAVSAFIDLKNNYETLNELFS